MIGESIYDYPAYYDLVFGADWKAEFGFLVACFGKHAGQRVRRVFEPACGTGRLLIRLARAGYDVQGIDLNPRAVEYCNARLRRRGFPASVEVGDMADFRLRRKVHAAFNTINSFRHLTSERQAEDHLRCVARGLAKGGIYILGFHLLPAGPPGMANELWSARRGHLGVLSRLHSIHLDLQRRTERVGITLDVSTPSRQVSLSEEIDFRTYTASQFHRLLRRVGRFEIAATYDFSYDIEHPIQVASETEDVIYVLKRD